jgi:hypothetical protein
MINSQKWFFQVFKEELLLLRFAFSLFNLFTLISINTIGKKSIASTKHVAAAKMNASREEGDNATIIG